MSEPNDFDPMDFEPIEASLKGQFSPPPLDALCDRVAELAADADEEEPETAPVQLARPRPPSWGLVAAAVAAAAAVLIVVLGPWSTPSTGVDPGPSEPDGSLVAVADPPTTSEVAGRQLDSFLDRDAMLPGDDGSCAAPAAPPEMCDGSLPFPYLPANSTVAQLGECGGLTGRSCTEFDLPADRALLVQLAPSGAKAIVCIEHPWTDPHPMLPASSDYNIFRRELGGYVLYEITPLATSTALEFVRI